MYLYIDDNLIRNMETYNIDDNLIRNMETYNIDEKPNTKTSLRVKADLATKNRCNTCICVLENPDNFINIGSVLRNINAFGIAKLYIVDEKNIFKNKTWSQIRQSKTLLSTSASAVKWTY